MWLVRGDFCLLFQKRLTVAETAAAGHETSGVESRHLDFKQGHKLSAHSIVWVSHKWRAITALQQLTRCLRSNHSGTAGVPEMIDSRGSQMECVLAFPSLLVISELAGSSAWRIERRGKGRS